MAKKLLVALLLVTLVCGSVFALAACAEERDPTVLNIVCLNAGYGKDWIEDLIVKFEADHPGYTVHLEAPSSAASTRSLITKHLSSRDNPDDLYISVGSDWMVNAAQGKFANLDSLVNETVDGVKLKDKVLPEYQNSIYYPDKNGELHTYRLPWIAATGGIFYNAKMFEKYGWTVPTTYDELVTLCQTIADAKKLVDNGSDDLTYVKPLIHTSENPDYFDYTVYTWWAQLAGKDAIKEFTQYGSPSNYSQSNPTYQKLRQATEMWYDLFKNPDFATSKMSNNDAQLAFCNGEAAMMFNADWMYNEIRRYQLDNANFSLALMKTPVATSTVADENILYTVGEDQYIAIPESSDKKELAMEFIKLIVSDYGCKTFLTKANGVLAYSCNYTAQDTDNEFLQNLLTVRNSYTTRFTNYPSMDGQVAGTTKMLYLTGQIDIWGTSALRPYSNLLAKTNTIEQAFTAIATNMTNTWDTLKINAGVK